MWSLYLQSHPISRKGRELCCHLLRSKVNSIRRPLISSLGQAFGRRAVTALLWVWENKQLWLFPSRTGKALVSYVATVCEHACANTETCAHGCVCIWRPETISGVFLNHSLPSFLRQDRSLTPRLDWLSSELQESRGLSTRITNACSHAPLSKRMSGDLNPGLQACTTSTLLPEPFSQPMYNYFWGKKGKLWSHFTFFLCFGVNPSLLPSTIMVLKKEPYIEGPTEDASNFKTIRGCHGTALNYDSSRSGHGKPIYNLSTGEIEARESWARSQHKLHRKTLERGILNLNQMYWS